MPELTHILLLHFFPFPILSTSFGIKLFINIFLLMAILHESHLYKLKKKTDYLLSNSSCVFVCSYIQMNCYFFFFQPIKRKKEGEEKKMTQEEMLLEAAQTGVGYNI